MRVVRWVRKRLVTPDAVYGLILYAALIAVSSTSHTDSLEVFLVAVTSLLVFWGAHVYSATIANHGMVDGAEIRIGRAFRDAVGHTAGMLFAAILPSIPLVLGIVGALHSEDAVNVSLVVVVALLGVLGYQSFAQRKSAMVVRILGAIGTALFGLFMIVLNAIVH